MEKLKRELLDKLPSRQIGIRRNEGLVYYYDYHGVTFWESEEERREVENYIIGVIEAAVGFKVRITEWGESNNGHFVHSFERI
ncbi:hypothetical protein HYT45_03390 [Candidatus Uhrbacteria bacterium]|nr:hypothetical protein [Candidatus Uhrbacteria bacterium]